MNQIPKHIAIIMDGNGRWANENGLPRFEGHREGSERVEEVVETCRELGVKYLTLYAFSDENWQRPDEEVHSLMELLSVFLRAKCEKMIERGVRFCTIGDLSKLPKTVLDNVKEAEEKTRNCGDVTLVLALSYGSHSEIVRAVNRALEKGTKEISISDIESNLDNAVTPFPELLIRTGGEFRVSNFLLWQIAYAELYFTNARWPDFGREELMKAVENYKSRERRFGRVGKESSL